MECRYLLPDLPAGELDLLVDCRPDRPSGGALREAVAARVGAEPSSARRCTDAESGYCASRPLGSHYGLAEGAGLTEPGSGCVLYLVLRGLDDPRVEALARRLLRGLEGEDPRALVARAGEG